MAERKTPPIAKLGLAAAALGAAALYNRRRARDAEAATPPAGRFVEVDGVRLHYVERGAGRPLVMLHGMAALVQDLLGSGLVDRAAAQYRVIAFDRPGYGYSERPGGRLSTPEAQAALIRGALAGLGIERPLVLGHSWGTLPALALALGHPRDVAGLVLLAGPYFPVMRAEPMLLAVPALPILGTLLANTAMPLLARAARARIVEQIFAPDPVPAAFAAFPAELGLRPSHIRATAGDAGLLQLAELRLSKRYAELQLPVAIVAGVGDRLVPFAQAERLHRLLPQSSLHRLERHGHMVHWVAPDRVMTAIREVDQRAV
ncbi:alpha/beta fold hydrolase [Sphingomonas sp. MAH-20]|uniref:Alpha/beta fold hydrolase n=1 Tax=Sphingomonas horti TaxID=2682842 RepID=A0A6I4J4H4_9SPHN|nr:MULTISPECIES: alpha/beta hydrolase [Sphingomonas]MBA2918965.1 alpha/beta hydrolase [Sphingomonas sp. CGMCC 1.13658]MVO78998.1 alpha/beta fold hydrolase [Sphingomonas horti]